MRSGGRCGDRLVRFAGGLPGVIPNTGLALLQRMVGSRVALELILSGRRLTSDEGVSRGLVNAVVPHESVIEKAVSWAHEIVSKAPPGAISAAKRHLHGHADYDWARVQQSGYRCPACRMAGRSRCFHRKARYEFRAVLARVGTDLTDRSVEAAS